MNPSNGRRDHAAETILATRVGASLIGRAIYAYPCVDSTMDLAHALAQEGASEGALVVAQRQGRGRGRLGRAWSSPEGGLYCSVILRPRRPAGDIPQLSLVAGLSAAEAIRNVTCLSPSIRWPNDLLLRGHKVGGILTEAKVSDTFPASIGVRHFSKRERCLTPSVVVGIGINVTTDPAELPDGSTSLAAEHAPHVTCEDVLVGLCRRFSAWYDVWTMRGFGPIREALRAWIDCFGHPVHITAGSERLEGTASDVDERGRLLVRLDSGLMRPFDVGDVTLLR